MGIRVVCAVIGDGIFDTKTLPSHGTCYMLKYLVLDILPKHYNLDMLYGDEMCSFIDRLYGDEMCRFFYQE